MSITIMTASVVADIIMMTMKSMSTIITTMTASAAIMTMTIIMKDITMQMMYLQAGEKRRLTNMIKKHLMLFLKNLPIQMNMAVF